MSDTADGSDLIDAPDPDDPVPGAGDPVATGTKGGGEWPDPSSPPSDSAPGSDPERAAGFQAEREGRTSDGTEASDDLHPPSRLEDAYDDEAAASGSIGGGTASGDNDAPGRGYGGGS